MSHRLTQTNTDKRQVDFIVCEKSRESPWLKQKMRKNEI